MMGGGLLVWLIIGVVIYMLFSRRGGMMGCCGGHGDHSSHGDNHYNNGQSRPQQPKDDIVDVKKEDYHVL